MSSIPFWACLIIGNVYFAAGHGLGWLWMLLAAVYLVAYVAFGWRHQGDRGRE